MSWPWSHPVVLNTGPLDWKSSVLLTTRPLLKASRWNNPRCKWDRYSSVWRGSSKQYNHVNPTHITQKIHRSRRMFHHWDRLKEHLLQDSDSCCIICFWHRWIDWIGKNDWLFLFKNLLRSLKLVENLQYLDRLS